jgi:hypothetical protein
MNELTLLHLKTEVRDFVREFSATPISLLFGVTDGKAVGTYIEQAFHKYLMDRYLYTPGSSASGIDLPTLEIDIKATSFRQPQSSCPFRNASQKVYGLGYHLLVFIYEKMDRQDLRAAQLSFRNAVFVSRERTGDYQTTYGLREILRRNGNKDDVVAFLEERNLPLDEIGREALAERILQEHPEIGYLTVSNALQWRLQYGRAIGAAGKTEGVGTSLSREFGDFQTPPDLVAAVLKCLSFSGKTWTRVIEPTCGRGNFIEGLLKQTHPPQEIQAIEIQDHYFGIARQIAESSSSTCVVIKQANVFDINLHRDLQWSTTGPLLVVGNPPWVTNAELGTLESNNLPHKRNIKGLRGIEARTGESNFDIAEYIWIKLIKELAVEQPMIALLCKTSVARNVLQFAFDCALPITHATIRKLDAKKWFGASVEACLFCAEVGPGERRYGAAIYPNLSATEPESIMGIMRSKLVANVATYERVALTDGVCPLAWRQGVKHDAASVMELTYDQLGRLQNKLGEAVTVESEYLYPLLKSTDVFHGGEMNPRKVVIVTQKRLGENTYLLKQLAPLLWDYLTAHANELGQRKSSIYEGQPPFAIFGIGDYSFAPYKVAISGLHKIPRFRAIGLTNGRPVMLDDTCYFIACHSIRQTAFLASLLNDPLCLDFINSTAFLDSKRPITKKLLQRIDLKALFNLVEKQSLLARAKIELARLGGISPQQAITWPTLEEILPEHPSNVDGNTGVTTPTLWAI